MSSSIPKTGSRSTLASSISTFLKDNPALHLGGDVDFHQERRHHLEVFGFHALPQDKQAPIGKVEFEGVRGPHGSIPIRLFYPKSFDEKKKNAALVYMHGGGYTVGSVDEFENGLRLLAEAAGVVTIGVEYRLAPEHHFPTQLDEYSAVVDWAQGPGGAAKGIASDLVIGGGDSAGGNMTEALSLRRRDEGKKNIAAQILLYPESRIPFDTPAATENNSGLYLECNGIFSFADHYLPKAPNKTYAPSYKYVSPGMQSIDYLKNQPPAALFTCGFDPLRDVGVEYGSKLQEAGVQVTWKHYPELTHGILQMAPWSEEAMKATMDVARELKKLAYGS
ncbi:Carboxylesterase NlhH [Lachnellula suecica]|uniref:Carboxylesterase NlhH n=1 Tax=Lachnellula suecica TaxID=602035 RepID=A0A8T9C2B8_9HELO|nr:Carboxylesterase NlhH [Lachnellula suecica]